MKHIITALLLALAVVAGLMMPGVWLAVQDESLEAPQTLELPEATLEWVGQGTKAELEEVTGEEIAWRLELFQNGPQVTVPIGTAMAVDVQRATDRALELLNMVLEVQPEVSSSGSEYQLAWFEDGTTIPFWTSYVNFNGDCAFIVNIDGESGAILQCIISPNGTALAELFPDSYELSVSNQDAHFEELVAQRFCDVLSSFMGSESTVAINDEPDCVSITFADSQESVDAKLYVDLLDGIWFNHS